MTTLAFIDTETTGLDDRTGEIWELALILRDLVESPVDTEYLWQFPTWKLNRADPMALKISKFYERRWRYVNEAPVMPDLRMVTYGGRFADKENQVVLPELHMDKWADNFVRLTSGAHLVGNVVSFDEERLRKLIRKLGYTPTWHYHLVDVENLIAGRIKKEPPWKSDKLSEAVHVPVPENRHGALPDARWARDMYDTVYISEEGQ